MADVEVLEVTEAAVLEAQPVHVPAVANKPRMRADSILVRASDEVTGLALLAEQAIAAGRPLDEIMRAMERAMEIKQRQQFSAAMHQFRGAMPAVPKAKWATIKTKDGGEWGYAYAPLDVIEEYARPVLHANGLSYRWVQEPPADGLICTVCIVRHVGGHEERTPYWSPKGDNQKITAAQNWAASNSFNKRQSLIAALGIVATDYFDDEEALARAREANAGPSAQKIKAPQRREDAQRPAAQQQARPVEREQPRPPSEAQAGQASAGQCAAIRRRADAAGIGESELARRFDLPDLDHVPSARVNEILGYLSRLVK